MNARVKKTIITSYRKSRNLIGLPHPKFIFLLGHMRSGSTLLMHILLSHPSITGIGESNKVYSTDDDLWSLVLSSRLEHRTLFQRTTYYADQINHNAKTPDFSIFSDYDMRYILLIREPMTSISSILRLSKKYYTNTWTLKKAEEYYIQRLEKLYEIAKNDHYKTLIMQYETLTQQPNLSLDNLTTWLNLNTPLSPEYQQFKFTGQRGDPSSNVRIGKIKTNLSITESIFSISKEAQDVYQKMLQIH